MNANGKFTTNFMLENVFHPRMAKDSMLQRRRVLQGAATVGFGGLIAGCSGNTGGETSSETTTAESTTAGSSEETETTSSSSGGSGNEIVYVTTQRTNSVDPMKANDELEGILTLAVYDGLLKYTYEFPPKLGPGVAKDWEVKDDTTYRFNLRDGVKFHNGDTLTAEDVAFSVNRMMTMNAGFSWLWDGVLTPDSVTAVDETTVELNLERTFAPFLATLPWLSIVSKKQVLDNEQSSGDYGDHGDFATKWLESNDAGTGPYTLSSREVGSSVTLQKNADWWGEFADQHNIDSVRFALQQEISTITGKMKSGSAHMTDRWLGDQTYANMAKNDSVKVSKSNTFMPYYVYMHVQKKPLDDVHVRRALSYAFDYKTANEQILTGGKKMKGPLPEGMKYFTTDGVPQFSKNVEKAKQELDKASYSVDEINSHRVSYAYQPSISTNKNVGLLMQNAFKQVGIDLKLVKMPWQKLVSQETKVDSAPKMYPLWSLVQYLDPDALLYGMWHSSNLNNYLNGSKYAKDEVDSLLERGRTTLGDEERAKIYKNLQQKIAEDAPALWVSNDAARFGLNADLQGFTDSGIQGTTHKFQNFHMK